MVNSVVVRNLLFIYYLLLKLLRWLKRKVSPLTIPNREVKPFSADGTAICGRVCRRLLLENRIILMNSSVFLLLFIIINGNHYQL